MKRILEIIPHIVIIIAMMILTFFVIDIFNEAMAFLDNRMTKNLVAVFAVLSVVLAVSKIYTDRRGN